MQRYDFLARYAINTKSNCTIKPNINRFNEYMKRLLTLYIFLVGMSTMLLAQSFTLRGKVMNEKMSPIGFATVMCQSQGKVAMTDLHGEFTLRLQSADSVTVKFSMLGYKSKIRTLRSPRGRQNLQIVLYPDAQTLDEVQVTEMKRQTGQTQEIKKELLKRMPGTNGNSVESLIQTQAGVSTHSELSSSYNVRGGAFDENSVYINNVEVFRPFLVRSGQQEGLSIINPDMVDKIGFSTGGFEAKYGDKMSSALDITYKNPQHFEASAEASMLGASAYAGFGGKNFSWSNGLRYKTTKYLLGSMETDGEYKPNFLDYQTYLHFTPNKRWTIDFIGNISDNHYNFYPESRETKFGTMENVKSFKVYFDGQEKDLFRTFFGSLGITRNIGRNTSLSLIGSAFHTKEQEKYDIQGQYWLTQTETSENLGVGTYFQHARNYLSAHVENLKLLFKHKAKQHNIESAVTIKREHIDEQSAEYEMRDSSGYNIPNTPDALNMIYTMRADNALNATRTEFYAQDTYRFTSAHEHTFFTLNYGVRMSHWNFNRETIFSPRLSLGIVPAFSQNTTFRIAAGLYYQAPFFKELRDTTTRHGITYATLNRNAKSQRSVHFIAGMDYRFNVSQRKYKFTAEAYYKALSRLTPYSINNVKVTYFDAGEASGHAMGLDFKLYGEFVPDRDSWLSLSLMDTKMKIGGKSIPLPTDQRWGFNLFFTDYFPGTDRWTMTLKLSYADGLPFSAPHREIVDNSFRAPAYKRADIGMSYRLLGNDDRSRKSIFKNIWLGIDCLNLFDLDNVNSYYWITDVVGQQYAVPNYLTGRQINAKINFEF